MTKIGILSDTHGLLDQRIFEHFSDDYDIVENTLSRISHTPAVPEPKHNISASNHISSSNDETEYFYGNSGKREAIHRLLGLMQTLEQPSTILFAYDNNLE